MAFGSSVDETVAKERLAHASLHNHGTTASLLRVQLGLAARSAAHSLYPGSPAAA